VLVSGKRFVANLIKEDQEAVAGWCQLRHVGTARVMLYEIQNPDTKANGASANNLGFSRLKLVGGSTHPTKWAAGAIALIYLKGVTATTSIMAMSRERCGGAFPPSISGDHHAILPA